MPRIAWLVVLALTACEADDGSGPLAAVAGHWEAEAAQPNVTDVLELDDDGNGTAQLFRYAAALSRLDGDVVVTPGDDELHFELSMRCNGRTYDCERYDFDTTCMLDSSDRLLCDAPEWYHDPDWIDFHAAD